MTLEVQSSRSEDLKWLENLHCDLLQYEEKCAFTNILLPLTENIERDHCYYYRATDTPNNNSTVPPSIPTSIQNSNNNEDKGQHTQHLMRMIVITTLNEKTD